MIKANEVVKNLVQAVLKKEKKKGGKDYLIL